MFFFFLFRMHNFNVLFCLLYQFGSFCNVYQFILIVYILYVNKIDSQVIMYVSLPCLIKLYNILQGKMHNRTIYGNRNTYENLF